MDPLLDFSPSRSSLFHPRARQPVRLLRTRARDLRHLRSTFSFTLPSSLFFPTLFLVLSFRAVFIFLTLFSPFDSLPLGEIRSKCSSLMLVRSTHPLSLQIFLLPKLRILILSFLRKRFVQSHAIVDFNYSVLPKESELPVNILYLSKFISPSPL